MQAKALRQGIDVLVATPGRLQDLMNDGACKLDNITYLVMDEADRMLDLGFEPHIRSVSGQSYEAATLCMTTACIALDQNRDGPGLAQRSSPGLRALCAR